jgi:hypothetical protein
MSLALFAAEYCEDPNKDEHINNKRNIFQRRIGMANRKNNKNNHNKPSSKVIETLNAIHSNLEDVDSEEKELMNFNPLEPPESSGGEKTKARSSTEFRENNQDGFEKMFTESPNEPDQPDESGYATQYYNNYVPETHLNYKPEVMNPNISVSDDIDQKLKYLIELIEQQRGERTEHVTEEILLYGLVGVFCIYVIDSFVTIGKYKR